GAGSYDLNDDGNTDFIAYTFHYEQAEDSRAQLLRLSLHYFDINGRGLVNGHGQLRLADDQNVYNVANLLNFNRVSFVPFTLPSGETIRTPTLMDNGYRPTVDRSKLEKRQGSSISPHIYFLEPVEQDGQVRLRTRVADS